MRIKWYSAQSCKAGSAWKGNAEKGELRKGCYALLYLAQDDPKKSIQRLFLRIAPLYNCVARNPVRLVFFFLVKVGHFIKGERDKKKRRVGYNLQFIVSKWRTTIKEIYTPVTVYFTTSVICLKPDVNRKYWS